MTRLPKKYFKSITDYVMTYYTAYGAKRADKIYDAVKTVTKNFTRTDPVYVRIGDDGEPEIHYTMTQANGTSYFANMDLGNVTLYVHNGKILTAVTRMFMYTKIRKVNLDSIGSATSLYLFNNTSWVTKDATIAEINAFDTSKVTNITQSFYYNQSIAEIPAFDFSAVTDFSSAFTQCTKITAFHATGMKVSFDISYTALKHDAILEVFNNLGEVDETAGITLTLGSDKLALMSDEEKAIATGKGWRLA